MKLSLMLRHWLDAAFHRAFCCTDGGVTLNADRVGRNPGSVAVDYSSRQTANSNDIVDKGGLDLFTNVRRRYPDPNSKVRGRAGSGPASR